MSKSDQTNVVHFSKSQKRAPSSTERIWGKAVLAHGYAAIPSILVKSQRRLGLSPTQMNIILQLLEYWFDPSRPPFPTKKQLAERMKSHPKTIQKNITALQEAGFIRREPQKTSAGDWGSNVYHLDGLVKKIQELEPEFTEAKKQRNAIAKRVETPKGLRSHSSKSRRSSNG